MVKCIECSLFSLQRVNEEDAINGYGHCERRALFIRHKAIAERDCEKFSKASDAVISKRNQVIKNWKT